MYDNSKAEKEFIVTNRLTYKGKPVGYKGFLSIRGKTSNIVDITNAYMATIEKDYNIVLNTSNTGEPVPMIQDGKRLYSDKECPILQPFNVYKILGFNDYRKNDSDLQKLYRELCDEYFEGKYRHTIVLPDAGLKEHITYKVINKDALEVSINTRVTTEKIKEYLIHVLITIDMYLTQGVVKDLDKRIQDFNKIHGTEVPITSKILTDNKITHYVCTSCLRDIELKRKLQDRKNYRCRCGGTIRQK